MDKMDLIKPIIWTIISIFALYIGINSTGSKLYIIFFMAFAVACAVFQWLAYLKKKRKQ